MSDRKITTEYCNDGQKFVQVNCTNMRHGGVEALCNQTCTLGHCVSFDQCASCTDFKSHYTEREQSKANKPPPENEAPAANIKPERQSVFQKMKSFASAEISGIVEGKLSDDSFAIRIATCKACPAFDSVDDQLIGWCKDCGCGRTMFAAMSHKARLPKSTCPRKLWVLPSV